MNLRKIARCNKLKSIDWTFYIDIILEVKNEQLPCYSDTFSKYKSVLKNN